MGNKNKARAAPTTTVGRPRGFSLELSGTTKLHPALGEFADILTHNWADLVFMAELIPVGPPVEVLHPLHAAERGEPENAGSILTGHDVTRANYKRGHKAVDARYAPIPDRMSAGEYVLRKLLDRLDLSVGQRALIAARLKGILVERAAKRRAHPTASAEDLTVDIVARARRRAARIAFVPSYFIDLAETITREAPDLAKDMQLGAREFYEVCWLLAERRSREQKKAASPPSPIEQVQDGLSDVVQQLAEGGELSSEAEVRLFEWMQQVRAEFAESLKADESILGQDADQQGECKESESARQDGQEPSGGRAGSPKPEQAGGESGEAQSDM